MAVLVETKQKSDFRAEFKISQGSYQVQFPDPINMYATVVHQITVMDLIPLFSTRTLSIIVAVLIEVNAFYNPEEG